MADGQVMPPLTAEQYEALKADIAKRGVLVPIEIDAGTGEIVDGFHRLRACQELGITPPTVERYFVTDDERKEHALVLNLLRRQLGPITWAQAFEKLLEMRGVKREAGAPSILDKSERNCLTVGQLSKEIGVPKQTAYRRMALAADLADHPALAKQVDRGDMAASRAQQIARKREAGVQSVHFSSETSEWYTPPAIIERTLKVLGQIDLDPCSNSHETPNVPAAKHFTREDDGLSQDWHGRVYMNPPYGRKIGDWVERLCQEHELGNVIEAIALIPSRTDTKWFRRLRQYPRCFIWGRLQFNNEKSGAPFPSMAVYLGKNLTRFMEIFTDIGDVYVYIGREKMQCENI